MDEIGIWRAAQEMRELYAADAAFKARGRAGQLFDQGDIKGFWVWMGVARALKELDRTEPNYGEYIN